MWFNFKNEILYIIVECTSLEQKNGNITDQLNLLNFQKEKLHKINIGKLKESSKEIITILFLLLMIDMLFLFYGFNYCKLRIMDTKENFNNLRNFGIEGKNDENNFYEYIKCDIKDERTINLIIVNLVNSKDYIIKKIYNIKYNINNIIIIIIIVKNMRKKRQKHQKVKKKYI